MMLFLEKRTRDLPRAVLAYDDLLGDWRRSLAAAEHALRIPDWSALDVPGDLQELAEAAFSRLSGVAVGTGTAESVAGSSIAAVRTKERRKVEREGSAERQTDTPAPLRRVLAVASQRVDRLAESRRRR